MRLISKCGETWSTTSSASPRAQQAVVDEDAGELVADGAVDEGGGDSAVDAARRARR